MKILVVDDDAVARALLVKIVTTEPGHQVTTAENGEEAWALLDDPGRWFDVVLLDLIMPDPDGFAILKRLRASPLHRSVEVILCTGSNDRSTVTKAVQLGVRHYVVKPCTDGVIRGKLKQIEVELNRRERRAATATPWVR